MADTPKPFDAADQEFDQWYCENAFDFVRNPIGSRECGSQRKAWHAGRAALAAKEAPPPTKDEKLQQLRELSLTGHLLTRAQGHPVVLEIMASCADCIDAECDAIAEPGEHSDRYLQAAKELRARAAAIRAEDPEIWPLLVEYEAATPQQPLQVAPAADFDRAVLRLVEHDVTEATCSLTGAFVGLMLELARRAGHDSNKQIRIDGEDHRDITIHASKENSNAE